MIVNKKYLIGQELLRKGFITEEELAAGIAYQEQKDIRLGHALVDLGYISNDDLLAILADQLGIRYVDFSAGDIPADVLATVSRDVVYQYHAIPVSILNDIVTVCVADPLNINLMLDLQDAIDKKVVPAIAGEEAIEKAIAKYYP